MAGRERLHELNGRAEAGSGDDDDGKGRAAEGGRRGEGRACEDALLHDGALPGFASRKDEVGWCGERSA